MTLAEWLNEYRSLAVDQVTRRVAEPEDDWAEQELLAPADRVRDTSPRWLQRAERVGYGRVTQI